MSKEHDTRTSLSREDAIRLEQSYKILARLQHTTLEFLHKLGEYEKNNRRRRPQEGHDADDGPSRLAFIVTPLMVNHYNHMHRVYRASMYGKVPDLCDQTGGIVCADLSALRDELATRTTDVNRSLGATFRTTVLPDVQFNFKEKRDNVLESAVRLLDTMNVKQPDLTYGIRDDYVQNVRAIQESLTGALEKSKERTAELQSRLDDALRKLALCEKSMVSIDDGNAMTEDRLRREILKLKDTILEQQRRLIEQEVSFNERFIDLVRSNEESELLRRLRDRLKQRFENETEGLARVRKEILEYAEKEMEQMSANFEKIREDVIGYTTRVLVRSGEERDETRKLFQNMLSSDEAHRSEGATAYKDMADRLFRLQNDHANLQKENENLKLQFANSQQTIADLQNVNEQLRQCHASSCDELIEGSRRNFEDQTQRLNAAHNEQIQHLMYENTNLKERVDQLAQLNDWQERDLIFFYMFFSNNIKEAFELASYMFVNTLSVYSEISRSQLIPYLETVLTDQQVKMYIHEMETARAEDIAKRSGVVAEIENTRYTVTYYGAVIDGLVKNMQIAHAELAKVFDFPEMQHEKVTLDGLNDYFMKLFGSPLVQSLLRMRVKLKSEFDEATNVIQQENHGLRQEIDGLRQRFDALLSECQTTVTGAGQSEQILAVFDGDPTVFEGILHDVSDRSGEDRLKSVLNSAYLACSMDNVTRYETSTENEELKLCHLVDYEVLVDHIKDVFKKGDTRGLREHENSRLNEPHYFLDYFLNQLGNVQVENYVKRKTLCERNRLALILFKHYYIPVINKESFVISIEGPFANFNMVYKV